MKSGGLVKTGKLYRMSGDSLREVFIDTDGTIRPVKQRAKPISIEFHVHCVGDPIKVAQIVRDALLRSESHIIHAQ